MKKILFSLLIALPGVLFAQNVGVGTTAPAARLDVVGTGINAETNVLMARNAASDTLFKVTGNGRVFIGTPSVADILNYKLRVETSNSNGSLFIENPIVTANTTVRILRGVAEANANGETTALDVEAPGDVAALFRGLGGIDVTATSTSIPAGNFTAPAGGFAINANGRLRFGNNGEASGRVLTSDANGYATWLDPSLVSHNHFGETWLGNSATVGLAVTNSNSTAACSALTGWMNGGGTQNNYGVQGISNSTHGIGIIGINTSTGSNSIVGFNSGVSGTSGSGPGVFGSSLTGSCIYGYKTFIGATGSAGKFENAVIANTDPVVLITNSASNPTALELNNGYIKVSGANKTAFTVTAITGAGGNTNANQLKLSYTGMASTDIIIAVHNFTGNYIGATGVWWDGTEWTVFREDTAAMPNNESFNILVIKQ